ncbi:MAG: hypothetical protein JRN26_02350 [Nitrososphaerota archaeon]|jgi:hypothetical protein|nr:hypothetical protein [Nitrososphaerota archaeon]MDG6930270.1 hypothetical protein [Nitrososphaerota archaeon]MDG6932985.1 hypothetical protein [Nitrososphaerota archaeon]MDG6935717.1 hypothetical protein [Nitrososphaerota archaeon]
MMPLYSTKEEGRESFITMHLKGECVKNWRMVELVALQTLEAHRNGELLARRADMDFIMRISLTDQIKRAQQDCLGNDVVLRIFDSYDTLPFDSFSEDELDMAEQAALLSVK